MFFFALATLLVLSAAEQSPSRNYLPQNNQGQGSFGQGQGGFGQGQGGFGQGQGGFGHGKASFGQGGFSAGGAGGAGGNTRPQQAVERSAAILKQDQDADLNGNFQYSFETSNGIRAAESGGAAQTQGEFSYQGDDGNTYTVSFRAGEGGFQASGAHLPVAPPTPAEILRALEQNAKDEAAGIFDDGKYRPSGEDGQYREANKGQSGFASGAGRGSGSLAQGAGAGRGGLAGGTAFGSANRQGSFNANSGYNY